MSGATPPALAPAQANRTLYAPSEADLAALLSMTQPADSPDAAAERRRQQILLPQLLTGSARGDALGMRAVDGYNADIRRIEGQMAQGGCKTS